MRFDDKIEQSLHGYDGGHRLLASSFELSSSEEKYLLELTDLSGHLINGFDEYLTGYSIPESKKYAFSKTWYAYEMERPGCVWTHTLLINQKSFQELFNLQDLIHYFRRPLRGNYSQYAKPIYLDNKEDTTSNLTFNENIYSNTQEKELLTLYATIFNHLYERINKIIIISDKASRYEKFIISMWSQMWGDLRAKFSFCTGSTSNRLLNGEPLILQVTSPQNISSFTTESLNLKGTEQNNKKFALVEESILNINPKNLERYIKIYQSFHQLLHEKAELSDDDILKFVWFYGKQLQPFRKNFGWLVRFYELISEPNKNLTKLDEITKALANKFPKKNEQRQLKLNLFGCNQNISKGIKLDEGQIEVNQLADEKLLVEYLLMTEYSEFLDINSLNLSKRFDEFWKKFPNDSERLLNEICKLSKLNDIQFKFLTVSTKFLNSHQVGHLLEESFHIAKVVIAGNLSLAADKTIWNLPISKQNDFFELLYSNFRENNSKNIVKWRKIVFAMLDVDNDYYAYRLYEMFDALLIDWVLDWHTKHENIEINGDWRELLVKKPDVLAKWALENKGKLKTKAFIVRNIIPDTYLIKSYGVIPWKELLNISNKTFSESQLLEINGFLLALGFSSNEQDARDFIVKSFATIYKAAERDMIPNSIWKYLKYIIPTGGIIFEWDKCRRLEEALIHLILEQKWGIELILDVSSSEHLLHRLIKRMFDYSRGRKQIWKLKDRIDTGKVEIQDWQRDFFSIYLNYE